MAVCIVIPAQMIFSVQNLVQIVPGVKFYFRYLPEFQSENKIKGQFSRSSKAWTFSLSPSNSVNSVARRGMMGVGG